MNHDANVTRDEDTGDYFAHCDCGWESGLGAESWADLQAHGHLEAA